MYVHANQCCNICKINRFIPHFSDHCSCFTCREGYIKIEKHIFLLFLLKPSSLSLPPASESVQCRPPPSFAAWMDIIFSLFSPNFVLIFLIFCWIPNPDTKNSGKIPQINKMDASNAWYHQLHSSDCSLIIIVQLSSTELFPYALSHWKDSLLFITVINMMFLSHKVPVMNDLSSWTTMTFL